MVVQKTLKFFITIIASLVIGQIEVLKWFSTKLRNILGIDENDVHGLLAETQELFHDTAEEMARLERKVFTLESKLFSIRFENRKIEDLEIKVKAGNTHLEKVSNTLSTQLQSLQTKLECMESNNNKSATHNSSGNANANTNNNNNNNIDDNKDNNNDNDNDNNNENVLQKVYLKIENFENALSNCQNQIEYLKNRTIIDNSSNTNSTARNVNVKKSMGPPPPPPPPPVGGAPPPYQPKKRIIVGKGVLGNLGDTGDNASALIDEIKRFHDRKRTGEQMMKKTEYKNNNNNNNKENNNNNNNNNNNSFFKNRLKSNNNSSKSMGDLTDLLQKEMKHKKLRSVPIKRSPGGTPLRSTENSPLKLKDALRSVENSPMKLKSALQSMQSTPMFKNIEAKQSNSNKASPKGKKLFIA